MCPGDVGRVWAYKIATGFEFETSCLIIPV